MKQREIKFRVWDKFQNKFLDHSCYFNSKDFNEFTAFDRYFKCDEEGCIVQQYTGLKDKNGKEIYEGDIIRSLGEDIGSIFGNNPIYTYGEIKWLCQSFKVCQSRIGATYLGDFADCDCCNTKLEIIGNIFENPDLIK